MSIWPPLIYMSMTLLSLGIELARHGQEKKTKVDFYSSLFATVVIYALLWWGGFFAPLFHRT